MPCRNFEDVLGGFGRSFQDLAPRRIGNAYCDQNPLIKLRRITTPEFIEELEKRVWAVFEPQLEDRPGE